MTLWEQKHREDLVMSVACTLIAIKDIPETLCSNASDFWIILQEQKDKENRECSVGLEKVFYVGCMKESWMSGGVRK
jgi:hypothetical protein